MNNDEEKTIIYNLSGKYNFILCRLNTQFSPLNRAHGILLIHFNRYGNI